LGPSNCEFKSSKIKLRLLARGGGGGMGAQKFRELQGWGNPGFKGPHGNSARAGKKKRGELVNFLRQ